MRKLQSLITLSAMLLVATGCHHSSDPSPLSPTVSASATMTRVQNYKLDTLVTDGKLVYDANKITAIRQTLFQRNLPKDSATQNITYDVMGRPIKYESIAQTVKIFYDAAGHVISRFEAYPDSLTNTTVYNLNQKQYYTYQNSRVSRLDIKTYRPRYGYQDALTFTYQYSSSGKHIRSNGEPPLADSYSIQYTVDSALITGFTQEVTGRDPLHIYYLRADSLMGKPWMASYFAMSDPYLGNGSKYLEPSAFMPGGAATQIITAASSATPLSYSKVADGQLIRHKLQQANLRIDFLTKN